MSSLNRRERQQLDDAVAAVVHLLLGAVQETIATGGPEPARDTIRAILHGEGRSGRESETAAQLVIYPLIGLLNQVRVALQDQPQRVPEILGWIESSLGRRYRARARYTAGVLESETGLDEAAHYASALGADYLPSMIWLLAGAVARYGDGDVEWLRELPGA